MIFRQFASVAGCVRSFMLAQKFRHRISEFWPKFGFPLKQQLKFVSILFRQVRIAVIVKNEISDAPYKRNRRFR